MSISRIYTDVFICDVLTHYYTHNENKTLTSEKFNINYRTLVKWINTEGHKIRSALLDNKKPIKALSDNTENKIISISKQIANPDLTYDERILLLRNMIVQKLSDRITTETKTRDLAEILKIVDSINKTADPMAAFDEKQMKILKQFN